MLLEKLLVEEDLMNELKNMNPRLLDYFTKNINCVK